MEIQTSEHVRDVSRGDTDPEQLHVQDPMLAEHAIKTSTRDRRAFLKLASGVIAAATALEAAPVAAEQRPNVVMADPAHRAEAVSNQGGDPAYDTLAQWDSNFAAKFGTVYSNPWTSGILPLKEVEMIALVINIACTNLQAAGTRHHIRAARAAGASHAELLTLIEFGTLLSIHSASLGAPMILDAINDVGVNLRPELEARAKAVPTPSCDKLKASGSWNAGWDAFFLIDPVWTEQYFTAYFALTAPFPPRLNELLSLAVDASITHMYAPGTERHTYGALKVGATPQEIMEVLKLCVSFGIESLRMGVPILAEEAPNG
jgi:alkylhydroperoxidase/carboxymuconolactone decarboxylase family protein YurZ